MTTNDPDLRTFLDFARGRLDINALGRDWENELVRAIRQLHGEPIRESLRRGFAKSVLGELTPEDYERATGWNFDTDADFRAHLRKYWELVYGPDDPSRVCFASDGPAVMTRKSALASSGSSSERRARLAPLGRQRLRLLACLGADQPSLAEPFDPGPEEDLFTAFRAFVESTVRRTQAATDALTRSLVGAGRLLAGDLAGAFEIVEHLPAEPPVLDHGAGYCLVAPVQALESALPTLPRELADTSRWLAGSREQAALRDWLARHHAGLTWDERRAVYVTSAGDGPAGSDQRASS